MGVNIKLIVENIIPFHATKRITLIPEIFGNSKDVALGL